MKVCNNCQLKKSKKDFWKDKKSKDGLQYRCIDCFMEYKNRNREKINRQAKDNMRKNKYVK
jgi:hypothetical protein